VSKQTTTVNGNGTTKLPPAGLATDILGLADALAQGNEAAAPAPTAELHLVTFHLGAEEYAVTIDRVREILRVGSITRLPSAPAHVRGVTNVRGRIIPVVDLRERMGLPSAEPGPLARILLCDLRGRLVGLLVDAVAHVMKVPVTQVSAPPEEMGAGQAGHVVGLARLGDRLVILLDLDQTVSVGAAHKNA